MEIATNYDKTVADPNFFNKYQAKKDDLESLMSEWETVHEALEALNE